jgi:hypothetical protein
MIPRCILAVAICVSLPGTLSGFEETGPDSAPTIFRWHSSAPNCSREDRSDGKFLYTLDTPQARFTLMVDGAELEKSHRTSERIFTLHLAVLLLGQGPMTIRSDKAALQLVRHHGVWITPLDPAVLAGRIRDETNRLALQTAKYIEKHPSKQAAARENLEEQQKLAAQWIEFLNTKSLRGETMTALTPKTSGWLYFPAETNGVRTWKSREEFVLRISAERAVVEFPFRLPPEDSPVLMHRPE